MKKFITVFIILLSCAWGNAQITIHKLVTAGFAYQNQSFGEVGGRLVFLNNDDVLFRTGATALMGSVNGKFGIMPKLQADLLVNFERGVDLYHSYYFLAGAETTNKYVAPKAGFTMFGLIDLTAGYAFPYKNAHLNRKQFKGLNINFTLNVPIVLIQDLTK